MTTTIRKKRQDDTRQDLALLTDQDVYLFREGSHVRLYEKLGAHPGTLNGVDGTHFAVWAPNAAAVSVIGDFNGWDVDANHLRARQDESGIWEGFVAGVGHRARYRYRIVSRQDGHAVPKCDPFGFATEALPGNASRVSLLDYEWGDAEWMAERHRANALDAPISVYEVHPGSWRRGGRGPLSRLPRARTSTGRSRARFGLHPRRADTDNRAPVLRVLGLPDHRLLRADLALRRAGGPHVSSSIISTSAASV